MIYNFNLELEKTQKEMLEESARVYDRSMADHLRCLIEDDWYSLQNRITPMPSLCEKETDK